MQAEYGAIAPQFLPIMLKVLLIRHGESVGNSASRMMGQSDDGLTPSGQQQCRQLGQWLHQQGWQPSHIYSSPLRRALASVAALIAAWHWQLHPWSDGAAPLDDLPRELRSASPTATDQTLPQLQVARALQEFDAGILTGLTWAEAQAQYPALCEALMTSPHWIPIPQAETPVAGRDRAHQFIQQLLAQHHNQDAVWIISHHWIMEHLIAELMGCDRTWQIKIPNTAIFEFWVDRDRWSDVGMSRGISDLWKIQRFGDRPHLGGDISPNPEPFSPS